MSGLRGSTRLRLTVLIAAVLVGCGALLLGAQYLAVRGLLTSAGSASASESVSDAPADSARMSAESQTLEPDATEDGAAEPGAEDGADQAGGEAGDDEAVAAVEADVLPALALWSAVALLVFAAVAVLVARWLSRRSYRRIAQITALAQRITAGDLDERIALGGRRDEVRELADTVDGMLDRLQRSFAQQGRFIANASHELRTPLTTTRTALEIPLAQGRVPADLAPAIRRALAANEKSERLIAALLALARVRGDGGSAGGSTERGQDRGTGPHAQTGLCATVIAALAARAARAAELELEVALDGLVCSETDECARDQRVAADPALVELAVDNLVSNAVRHNVSGGHVRISLESDARALRLRVENTGAQLTPETIASLLEPFNRGDASRLAAPDGEPGLGLGLTLADEAARACGGSLDLVPRPGGGLVAVLRLPRAADPERQA